MGGGRVLIVESNLALRRALTEYLSSAYNVQDSKDIEEALREIKTFEPDIILLDRKLLSFQESEILNRLKRATPTPAAIILLSGELDIDDAVAAMKWGASDFLPKPVKPLKLAKIIEENLKQVRHRRTYYAESENRYRDSAVWCLTGNMESTPLPDLLQFMNNSRMSGILEISGGLITTTICFREGEILFAGSSDPRLFLGHLLIARGILNENQLSNLLRRQTEEQTLLGKLVIQEKIVDEQTVEDILMWKIVETVTNLFLHQKGLYTFYQNLVTPYSLHNINVSLLALIMNGELRREQWKKLRSVFSSSEMIPILNPESRPLLTPTENLEANVLSLLDGNHSIQEILLETHGSEFEVFSILHRYYTVGALLLSNHYKSDSNRQQALTADALERTRRLLIAGEYEKALHNLYKLMRQPDCDLSMALPLLEDAEQLYNEWFYLHRIRGDDIPVVLRSFSERTANWDANDLFLMKRINGILDVRSLINISPLRETEVLLSLQHLLDYGIIGIVDPVSRHRIAETDHQTAPIPAPYAVLEQLFRELPLGVIITGRTGSVTYVNDRFLEMSGLKREEIEGMQISKIFRGEVLPEIADRYEREFHWKGISEGTPRESHWLYSVHPFDSNGRNETGMTILVRNVTESKRKELERLRQDRVVSLGEFVAGMTHQLKNPMMMLETGVKLLRESPEKEDSDDIVRRMQNNIERARNIIGDMLNYVSMDPSSFDWIDLNDLIEKTIPLLKEQLSATEISFQFIPLETIPRIRANETSVREILMILATNAIQAMQTKGSLQISTDIQEELEGGIFRKYLLMVVSDTGPGMTEGVVEKLFTPFFTTKPGGRGLGLAFAKRMVEEQGGLIRCWSKEGIGTHFYVYFRIGGKYAFDSDR
jgi:PAS domain S-box-containing protein